VKKFWDKAESLGSAKNGLDKNVPPLETGHLNSSDMSVRPTGTLAGEGARPTHAVVPPSVQIGSVRISPATVLAPMAGVTDTVFRRFIRNLGGCGLIMTEFT